MAPESPHHKVVRLYTTTDATINEILAETGVSRPTLFRYLKLSGVEPNRRSPNITPESGLPQRLGMDLRIKQQNLEVDPPVIATPKFQCIRANCMPLEPQWTRAFRFLPGQVTKALQILRSMRLTIIWNNIGHPSEWGAWLVGPKFFSDPAVNPAYPMTLEDEIGILEDPKGWLTENAERIKAYTTKRREERTQRVNDLVSRHPAGCECRSCTHKGL